MRWKNGGKSAGKSAGKRRKSPLYHRSIPLLSYRRTLMILSPRLLFQSIDRHPPLVFNICHFLNTAHRWGPVSVLLDPTFLTLAIFLTHHSHLTHSTHLTCSNILIFQRSQSSLDLLDSSDRQSKHTHCLTHGLLRQYTHNLSHSLTQRYIHPWTQKSTGTKLPLNFFW